MWDRFDPQLSTLNSQLSNSALQYTSLTNFDQLSIRTSWRAYIGFQVGRAGGLRSFTPACCGVRSAFRLLHFRHASTLGLEPTASLVLSQRGLPLPTEPCEPKAGVEPATARV